MKHVDKRAITVNPTNKCNLRCTYCMASSGDEQFHPLFIDQEFANRGIEDAFKGHPTGIVAEILRFFSPGEPTQNMTSIKKSTQYSKKINPDISVELQTNGLFDSIDDTEWIRDNVNVIWISLDGPKAINGKYRPNMNGEDVTSKIERNIEVLKEKAFVGIRATIVDETVNNQISLIDYYYNLGIDYLNVNPKIESIKKNRRDNHGTITYVSIKDFTNGFLEGFNYASEIGMNYGSSLTFNFDEPTCIACRSCLPMPQLNPDGSVSSCDMALYKNAPKELQPFIYGTWNPENQVIEYNLEKINYLKERRLPNLPKCKDCECRENCAGSCAGRIAYEKGNIYDIIPEYCAAIKYLAKNLPRNQNKIPKSYTHP